MAIDSENKRRSTLGYIGPYVLAFPAPDGSALESAAERAHATWRYASLITSVTVTAIMELTAMQRTFTVHSEDRK